MEAHSDHEDENEKNHYEILYVKEDLEYDVYEWSNRVK